MPVSEFGTVAAMVEMGEHAAPRIPFWKRIEPRCRNDNFALGLEAKSADPFWMLARQWQVGEFQGEDTGSPISVEFTTRTQAITEAELGTLSTKISVDENSQPLEMIVEREYLELDWRSSVRIGQQLERLLRAETEINVNKVICQLRQNYPIKRPGPNDHINMDRATQRFLNVMAGRVIDGCALIKVVQRAPEDEILLPAQMVNWLENDEEGVKHAIGELLKWFESLYGSLDARQPSPSSAWVPEDLEYTFKVNTGGTAEERTTLVAPHYRNGDLDWYTFSVYKDGGYSNGEEKGHKFVPTRVSFPGMPYARWWAFEDNQVDFGNVEAATTDLAKLMIMNFAMLYGDDWFIVPLPAKVNTLTRIKNEHIMVTDVFGQVTNISPARSISENPWETWQMFGLSFEDNPNDMGCFLYLPPTVNFRQESPPVEEVRFIRDEMANMVWGIEHTVANGLGEPVQGFEAQIERRTRKQEALKRETLAEIENLIQQLHEAMGELEAALEESGETPEALASRVASLQARIAQLQATLETADGVGVDETATPEQDLPSYKLSTTVPDNWIPFVPVRVSPGSFEVYLRQAQMVRNETDQAPIGIEPMSRLLSGVNETVGLERIHEEAITRAGQRMQMTKQRVRWANGKTNVWIGRKIGAGRGEGSSGIFYDYIKLCHTEGLP